MVAAIPLCSQSKGVAHFPLPADLSGTLDGAEYTIRVPANWNGTLLVRAHGAMSAAVEVAPPADPPTAPTLEEQLPGRSTCRLNARGRRPCVADRKFQAHDSFYVHWRIGG